MNTSWQILLSRVDSLKFAETHKRIPAFLELNGLQAKVTKPVVNSAYETLNLWQVRQVNTLHSSLPIPGVDLLIDNLRRIQPDAEVEQYGFTGDTLAGSLFFNRQTGEFLGDTIVPRRPKRQKILDLEAQLTAPSRKSA